VRALHDGSELVRRPSNMLKKGEADVAPESTARSIRNHGQVICEKGEPDSEVQTVTNPMQLIHGAIAFILLAVALLHVPHPTPFIWVPYALGSALAIVTLFADVSLFFSRLLAISTTMLMFFFFAGFFMDVPKLESDWYVRQEGWFAVSRLLAAFAMLPILSDYSCRCKADCIHARAAQRLSFFRVPDHIRPRNR